MESQLAEKQWKHLDRWKESNGDRRKVGELRDKWTFLVGTYRKGNSFGKIAWIGRLSVRSIISHQMLKGIWQRQRSTYFLTSGFRKIIDSLRENMSIQLFGLHKYISSVYPKSNIHYVISSPYQRHLLYNRWRNSRLLKKHWLEHS